jgi:hypothetical protein
MGLPAASVPSIGSRRINYGRNLRYPACWKTTYLCVVADRCFILRKVYAESFVASHIRMLPLNPRCKFGKCPVRCLRGVAELVSVEGTDSWNIPFYNKSMHGLLLFGVMGDKDFV